MSLLLTRKWALVRFPPSPGEIDEIQRLEREGIAKIQEQAPHLVLTVPDHRNEEKVITALAKFARKGFVTEFKSKWVK